MLPHLDPRTLYLSPNISKRNTTYGDEFTHIFHIGDSERWKGICNFRILTFETSKVRKVKVRISNICSLKNTSLENENCAFKSRKMGITKIQLGTWRSGILKFEKLESGNYKSAAPRNIPTPTPAPGHLLEKQDSIKYPMEQNSIKQNSIKVPIGSVWTVGPRRQAMGPPWPGRGVGLGMLGGGGYHDVSWKSQRFKKWIFPKYQDSNVANSFSKICLVYYDLFMFQDYPQVFKIY